MKNKKHIINAFGQFGDIIPEKYLCIHNNTINISKYTTKLLNDEFHQEIIDHLINEWKFNEIISFSLYEKKKLPIFLTNKEKNAIVKIDLDRHHCSFDKKMIINNNEIDFFLIFYYTDKFNYKLLINNIFEKKYLNENLINKPTVEFLFKERNKGFYLKKFDLEKIDIDFTLNYNLDITKEKIFNVIESSESGFILFSGKPGTGKTSFIQYLAQKYKNKKFVFIPSQIAEILADPEFLNFVISKLRNSVLIIEDSEKLFMNRNISTNGSHSASTILNITDGILSKILNLKIITTQNTIENIDNAFLRKGRLLQKVTFLPLKPEQANKLAKKLGINIIFREDIPVCDIYNHNNNGNLQEKELGFIFNGDKIVLDKNYTNK